MASFYTQPLSFGCAAPIEDPASTWSNKKNLSPHLDVASSFSLVAQLVTWPTSTHLAAHVTPFTLSCVGLARENINHVSFWFTKSGQCDWRVWPLWQHHHCCRIRYRLNFLDWMTVNNSLSDFHFLKNTSLEAPKRWAFVSFRPGKKKLLIVALVSIQKQ